MSRQQVPGWAVQCCAEQEFAAHGVCSSQAVGGSCPKQTNQLIPGKQQGELFQPFSWSTQDQNNSNKLFFHTLEQWKSWDFACDSTLHPSPATARTELSRDAETGWGTSQEGLCLGHHSEQSLLWHCSPWGSGQAAAQSASPARTGLLWLRRHNEPWLSQENSGKCRGWRTRICWSLNSKWESWKPPCSYFLISKFSSRIGGSTLS